MARTQTMVQLTEELVGELDEEARRRGLSRSALIREALDAHLRALRARDVGRRIVEGYRSVPALTPDAWGDLADLANAGTRELGHRLDAEERRSGHTPW